MQGCGGCKEYRDLYLHWETIGCRVAVVARSTETCTCPGRPSVAGLRLLQGVQRLIPALGDHRLQGCGCCEEYRDLYLHWETYGCRVAVGILVICLHVGDLPTPMGDLPTRRG